MSAEIKGFTKSCFVIVVLLNPANLASLNLLMQNDVMQV